jgi:hypothetical protein
MSSYNFDEMSKFMTRILNYFVRHLDEQNMSYKEHFYRASLLSLKMVVGAILLLIHAVFPFVFERSGSRMITHLYNEVSHTSHTSDNSNTSHTSDNSNTSESSDKDEKDHFKSL